MSREYRQIEWDAAAEEECRRIVRAAVMEDLDRQQDWTTVSLVPMEATGRAAMVTRQAGVVAGMPAVRLALAELDSRIEVSDALADGSNIPAETSLAVLAGPARSLLTAERIALNLIGR